MPPQVEEYAIAGPPAARREHVEFDPPRPVSDWIRNGQVVAGHEPVNGLALPLRVVETIGESGPPQYVVIGETRYGDGRWFLDFAVSQTWANYHRAETACGECGGLDGAHASVTVDDQRTGRPVTTRCPSDPSRGRKRAFR